MRTGFAGWAVFGVALAVRLLYLIESARNPIFATPVVDAATYHDLASGLASGAVPGAALFWQPVFYPLFLAAVYTLGGPSMLWAESLQAVIGATTCVLTCRLGERLFDRRAGILAGAITACYGPLVFFDGQLLATGWAVFWSVALLLGSFAVLRGGRPFAWAALGLGGGLAVLTRPTFLPFLVLLLPGLAVSHLRRGASGRAILGRFALAVAGLALVLLPAASASARYSERFSILPASGGINLYVGNNPDRTNTVALRPGWEWSELTRMPERFGVERRRDTSAFFKGLVLDYAREQPAAFAAGLAAKAAELASPRELPRNVDLYVFRKGSAVLRLLVWKIGPFGFPFGVLLPLALVGASLRERRGAWPFPLFLVSYGLSIVAVFVSARYRAPLVPALAVLAGGGLAALPRELAAGRGRRLAGVAAVAVLVAALACLPGPFPAEGIDYEAELLYLVGTAVRKAGDPARAVGLLTEAVERVPSLGDAENQLGNAWADLGRSDLALEHYRRAVEAGPGNVLARENHGRLLLYRGRNAEAAEAFREALRLRPGDAELRRLLDQALAGD